MSSDLPETEYPESSYNYKKRESCQLHREHMIFLFNCCKMEMQLKVQVAKTCNKTIYHIIVIKNPLRHSRIFLLTGFTGDLESSLDTVLFVLMMSLCNK